MLLIMIVPMVIGIIFFYTLSNTIYGGDAGDLVSAILTRGHAHPPGYSLYTLLGILFHSLPINFLTPAGKVTLISSISTVFSLIFLALIIREIASPRYFNRYLLVITLLIIGFNYVIWLYAVVPELFPLNTLIVLAIFYFALKFVKTKNVIFIYALNLFIGLGISHHHTFLLVIPSIAYLIYTFRVRFAFMKKNIFFCLSYLILGLLPLSYLVYVSKVGSEFQWEKADSLAGFLNLMLRKAYGTFVPGSFISQILAHRLLQIKVLFNSSLLDFSLFGIFLFLLGISFYLRLKRGMTRTVLTAAIINLFFFGPFYFFYANFPLSAKFFFATLERFSHVYYFFFAIILYFGLFFLKNFIQEKLLAKYIHNSSLKKFSNIMLILILALYPAKLAQRNFVFIGPLKNDSIAEKLGFDVLNNAQKKSLIFLSQDTILFDTQYVYYAYPKKRNDKIVIHLFKLGTTYYPKILGKYYPKLKITTTKEGRASVAQFSKDNLKSFNIYANEILNIAGLDDYEWVTQGLLFKLVKKGQSDNKENYENLKNFWQNSLNKNLGKEVITNKYKFKNLFLDELLDTYSVGRQNSADYLMQTGRLEEAYSHIQSSAILKPDEADQYLLLSKYQQKKVECKEAEKNIDIALKKSREAIYLAQLADLKNNCFQSETDKKRIARKLENYLNQEKTPLKSF